MGARQSIYARTDFSTSLSVLWVSCGSVMLIFAGVSETDFWAGGKDIVSLGRARSRSLGRLGLGLEWTGFSSRQKSDERYKFHR